MKKKWLSVAATAALLLLFAVQVQAIPSLQLDIAGGTYNPKDGSLYDPMHDKETIIAPTVAAGEPITLYAYLSPDGEKPQGNPNATALLGDYYYLSLAIYPKVAEATPSFPDLGTISVNGVDIKVTESMRFGTPPYETQMTQLSDPGDLSSHGVYETYFMQLQFTFDPNNVSNAYNTQDMTGAGPSAYDPLTGSPMYYEAFSIDTTGLAEGYYIHFDLYNSYVQPETVNLGRGVKLVLDDTDVNSFAPFSHDAESNGNTPVPEPSTLILLGAGMLGLGFARRKKIA